MAVKLFTFAVGALLVVGLYFASRSSRKLPQQHGKSHEGMNGTFHGSKLRTECHNPCATNASIGLSRCFAQQANRLLAALLNETVAELRMSRELTISFMGSCRLKMMPSVVEFLESTVPAKIDRFFGTQFDSCATAHPRFNEVVWHFNNLYANLERTSRLVHSAMLENQRCYCCYFWTGSQHNILASNVRIRARSFDFGVCRALLATQLQQVTIVPKRKYPCGLNSKTRSPLNIFYEDY